MNKILKFSASWCQPCNILQKQIDNLNKDKKFNLIIDSIDVDDQYQLANQYAIRSLPTLIEIDPMGNEIKRITGSLTNDQLVEFCNE